MGADRFPGFILFNAVKIYSGIRETGSSEYFPESFLYFVENKFDNELENIRKENEYRRQKLKLEREESEKKNKI